jgi:hypothetical protein
MAEHDELYEHRVREIAFQLWQEAGCPEGRSDEYWQKAKEAQAAAAKPEAATDLVEEAGGHYPPTGDTQNFA